MLERALWRDFIAVTFSVAVLGLGYGSTLPLSALALTARGHGPDVVGWMAAAVALGGIAGTLITPRLTARHGRPAVMLGSIVVTAASTMALQASDSLAAWAVWRALFGVAMAPLFVLGESWINGMPSERTRGRVVAIYTTSFTLFMILGPLMADALAQVPGRTFLICGGVFLLGIPGIALAWRGEADASDASANPTSKPAGGADRTDADATWWQVFHAAPVIVAGTAFFAAFDTVFLSFLPLLGLDAGMTQRAALAAVSVVLLGDAMLQLVAGWLADRYGRARIHALCGAAMVLMLPCLPWLVHRPVVWEVYLFVLGGLAGAIYTLSMVASGQCFNGAALVRSAGLIGLTWNAASIVGPAATGLTMQRYGGPALVGTLWLLAVLFAVTALASLRSPAPSRAIG